jgi:hypothetical protein
VFKTVKVTLKLPKNLYKTASAISILLDHDDFADYLRYLIESNIEQELTGGTLGTAHFEDLQKKLLGSGDAS